MTSGIAVERRGEIALVTITRPKRRNALNEAAWMGLGAAFVQLSRDGETRCVILTGAEGHFCAGDDLKESGLKAGGDRAAAYALLIEDAYAALRMAPFPVIAAISGACMGGGLSLAMHCDFRLADASARFAIPAAKIGDYYPASLCLRLMLLAGPSVAKHMLMTGDAVDGVKASRSGLADDLEDDVQAAALALAERLASRAPLMVQASKRAVDAYLEGRFEKERAAIDILMDAIKGSDDRLEGSLAFLEKRDPAFAGR